MDGTSPNDVNNHNRYSAPLNYHDASQNQSGGVANNRRSAPEFLTEHNS